MCLQYILFPVVYRNWAEKQPPVHMENNNTFLNATVSMKYLVQCNDVFSHYPRMYCVVNYNGHDKSIMTGMTKM